MSETVGETPDMPPAQPAGSGRRRAVIFASAGGAAAIPLGALFAAGVFSGPQPFAVRGVIENSDGYQVNVDDPSAANTWISDPRHPGRCMDAETVNVMATVGGRDVTVASAETGGDGYKAGTEAFGRCDSNFTVKSIPGGYASYGFQCRGCRGRRTSPGRS